MKACKLILQITGSNLSQSQAPYEFLSIGLNHSTILKPFRYSWVYDTVYKLLQHHRVNHIISPVFLRQTATFVRCLWAVGLMFTPECCWATSWAFLNSNCSKWTTFCESSQPYASTAHLKKLNECWTRFHSTCWSSTWAWKYCSCSVHSPKHLLGQIPQVLILIIHLSWLHHSFTNWLKLFLLYHLIIAQLYYPPTPTHFICRLFYLIWILLLTFSAWGVTRWG